MAQSNSPISRLIDAFASLPSIGKKSAERLAYHVLKMPNEEALEFAESIRAVKENLRPCKTCFNLSENEECDICKDPRRDQNVLCVVEQVRDLLAIEQAGSFRGVYHVLQGRLSPLDGVGPEQLSINKLVARLKEGVIHEVIMGLCLLGLLALGVKVVQQRGDVGVVEQLIDRPRIGAAALLVEVGGARADLLAALGEIGQHMAFLLEHHLVVVRGRHDQRFRAVETMAPGLVAGGQAHDRGVDDLVTVQQHHPVHRAHELGTVGAPAHALGNGQRRRGKSAARENAIHCKVLREVLRKAIRQITVTPHPAHHFPK